MPFSSLRPQNRLLSPGRCAIFAPPRVKFAYLEYLITSLVQCNSLWSFKFECHFIIDKIKSYRNFLNISNSKIWSFFYNSRWYYMLLMSSWLQMRPWKLLNSIANGHLLRNLRCLQLSTRSRNSAAVRHRGRSAWYHHIRSWVMTNRNSKFFQAIFALCNVEK